MTLSSTGTRQKPALDEGSFQQLLAAAYTVQQHNGSLRPNDPSGTSRVLSSIAEIQSQVRTGNLNVAESTALVAQQLLTLTNASGVSISLVDNGFLDCVAESGKSANIPGSCISSHSLVATERLKSGLTFESENSQTDLRLDGELCQRTGVASLVAAPVLRFGEIAGLVEVRWTEPRAFAEPELRTCRLMAGLVTGTLERSIRIGSTKPRPSANDSPEAPTAAQLSPEVPQSVKAPDDESSEVHSPKAEVQESAPGEWASPWRQPFDPSPLPEPSCRMCGRDFAGTEQFCGFCSMPRPVESRSEELQSKWASMWFMQRAQGALQDTHEEKADTLNGRLRLWGSQFSDPEPTGFGDVNPVGPPVAPKTQMWPAEPAAEPVDEGFEIEAREPVVDAFPWDERTPLAQRAATFSQRHWRDAILASVVLALAYGAFMAWPRSANHPTWFQSLMVRVGIMEPRTKVFAGAPETRVWIDVHTQLYYCSGEDLYGKTPDGEFTTQYNAQSDGFLPASNTTCP